MAVTKAALKSAVTSFFDGLANDVASEVLANVPLAGQLALPAGQAAFKQLSAAINAAIDAAGPDTADLINALNSVDGVTASMNGDDILLGFAASESLSLADSSLNAGAGAAGIGLSLGGSFSATLTAALNTQLRLDGATGDLLVLDNGGTKELSLKLQSDLSVAAQGDLGLIGISVADKDPNAPEIDLSADIDLATGKVADALAAPLNPTFTGHAGLDLQVVTTVLENLLPSISTELTLDYDLQTGVPLIKFNDVSVDVGSFLSVFSGVFKDIYDVLDSFPLGVILDIADGPLPIIDDFAHSLGLASALDLVPLLRDDKISLADLAVLYDSFAGTGIGKFFEGLATVDLIRQLAGDFAQGTVKLGDFTVADNPASTVDSFLGQLPQDVRSAFDDILSQGGAGDGFSSKGGLNIPLLDDPSLIVKILLNSVYPDGVPLVEFDLPDLSFTQQTNLDFPILGPLALTLEGDASVGIDIGIGYDTTALQTGNFEDGVFFTNFDSNWNPSVTDPVAYLDTRIGAGVALNAFIFRASATGGVTFDIDAYLHDADGDRKMRFNEIVDCFFDPLEGKAGADVRVKLKIGFGPFSYTKSIPIASVVLVDFSFGCPPPSSPPDHGLATLASDGTLVLNTGPRASIRIINTVKGDDTKDIEGYKIGLAVDPDTGAVIPGALAISAFGMVQSFGGTGNGPLVISGDLGLLDDSLQVSADVTQAVQVHGGEGQDLLVGGSGADKLYGDNGDDYLVGNLGDDILVGGAGDDTLVGGAGADTLSGGAGIDEVSYADANTDLGIGVQLYKISGVAGIVGFGGEAEGDHLSGIDHLTGTNFADVLTADDEVDGFGFAGRVLEGLAGNDVLLGGTGDDFLLGGAGGDLMLGGAGHDGTSYLTSFGGVVVDLGAKVFYGGDAQGDWLDSVEDVYGSGNSDTLIGDASNNRLDGFLGNDQLDGGGGRDIVSGGEGNDIVYARGDGDTLDGGGTLNAPGTDLLSYRRLTTNSIIADLGNHVGYYSIGMIDTYAVAQYLADDGVTLVDAPTYSTFENLEGTDLASAGDTLTGDDGDNVIWGLNGNDTIRGGNGFDHLIGGLGADALDGGAGLDWAEYQDSADAVTVYLDGTAGTGGTAQGDVLTNVENLLGSDQSDNLYGDANNNVIDPGLAGANRYYDYVNGGAGTDTLRVNYSHADYGQGLNGGFFSGSSSSGYLERRDASGATVFDAVSFNNIEALDVTGTRLADTVYGGLNADVITTGGGNDTVYAGLGIDRVSAGDGNDFVAYGTDINRALSASSGETRFDLDGGSGIDTLSLSLAATTGAVVLSGKVGTFNGTNLVTGLGGDIRNFEILKDVWTGSGDDILTQQGRYDNVFRTGDGSDTIRPGLGFDTVDGGPDTTGLVYADNPNYYRVNDWAAFLAARGDTLVLDYSSLTDAKVTSYTFRSDPQIINVDGQNTTNSGSYSTIATNGSGTITNQVDFTEIERLDVTGSQFDDVLTGTDVDFVSAYSRFAGGPLNADRGDDTLRGMAGNDWLIGYSGNDTLDGGAGNDTLEGAWQGTKLANRDEPDLPTSASEIDTLTGGTGADVFILGGYGNDNYYYGDYNRDALLAAGRPESHAIITDFNAAEGDRIRLNGFSNRYFTSEHDGVTDIYRNVYNNGWTIDLIATVEGTTNFDLSASYVEYVEIPPAAGKVTTLSATPTTTQTAAELASASSSSNLKTTAAAASATPWIVQEADPDVLLQKLGAGSGVVAGSQSLTVDGSGEGFGYFDGDPFGLGSGVILSTGKVTDLMGPNTSDGPDGPTSTSVALTFVKIGRAGNSDIYRADLSGLGIDVNSIRFTDGNTHQGGSGGIASGFDIDSFALSTTKLDSVASTTNLNDSNVLPKLDAFDYDNAHLFYTPGTQRAPSGGYPYGPDLLGSVNGYAGSGNALVEGPARKLSTFSQAGQSDSISLGDGGSLGVNLNQSVSTDGPLYLYIGEEGGTGEAILGSIDVSSDLIQPAGDLSSDLGAPGLDGDTSTLTYSFTPTAGTDLVTFQVVLFSEELPEHAGILDPDAVNVTLNGVSIASLSDGASADLNTLMNSPYSAGNADLVLNPAGTGPLADQVAADAYTKTLTFVGRVQAGTQNTLVVQAADTRDAYLDTGILVKGGTFLSSGGALPTNLAPFAVGDVAKVAYGTAYSGNVLTNDVDPEGAALTAKRLASPAHGTLAFGANGNFIYTPDAGFFGVDTFTYRATDGDLFSDPATVTLVVAPPAGVVGVADGPYSASEDTVLSVSAAAGVLANDSAPSGTALTARLVSGTLRGALTLNADGSFIYTPKAGYSGSDRFVYQAVGGGVASDNVVVTINTAAVNDAPIVAAGAQSATLVEAGVTPAGAPVAGVSTATIALTKVDPDVGDTASFLATGWSDAGAGLLSKSGTYGSVVLNTSTGLLTYTLDNSRPATNALKAGAVVADTFSVTVTDTSGATMTRNVAFKVAGTNDAPTLTVGAPSGTLVEAGVAADNSAQFGLATASIQLTKGDPDSGDVTAFSTSGWTYVGSGRWSMAGTYGTAILTTATGRISYTLDNSRAATNALPAGASAQDSFTVSVRDAAGASTSATAIFAIQGTDDRPSLAFGPQSALVVEKGTGVAGNAVATMAITRSDPDSGDSVSFDTTGWSALGSGRYSRSGTYGNVVLDTVAGTLTYTLDNARAATDALETGDTRQDFFSVTVKDSKGARVTRTAAFTLAGTGDGVTIIGTSGADVISASRTVRGQPYPTTSPDIIEGRAGDDVISGLGGKDDIDGGDGNDIANYDEKTAPVVVGLAGAGNAIVSVGGVAEDTIRNIEGVIGGSADDILVGDGGNNFFMGRGGRDTINGNAGIDTASYEDKTTPVVVVLYGNTYVDVSVGGANEDRIRAVENIIGGSGNDILFGDGLDNVLAGRGGNDVLDGRAGVDTADYGEKTASVAVTLNGSRDTMVAVGGVDEDRIRNIENIIGGSAGDRLTGDGYVNTLWGEAGNDVLKGGGGRDILDGGAGSDTADYADQTAPVVVTLNTSNDAIVTIGGVADDTVRNIENIIGGSADDILTGDTAANVFSGRGGKDTLDGGGGRDTADYADKTASVVVQLRRSTFVTVSVGGVAEDTIRNIENIVGGSANDTLVGDQLGNVFTGRGGKDYIDGAGGIDTADYSEKSTSVVVTLNQSNKVNVAVGGVVEDTIRNIENIIGGSADDRITGDALDNVLSGGRGNDRLDGGDGNDTLNGGLGADILAGRAGDDTYIVDSLADVVVEATGGGTDTVQTTLASLTLAANVENLAYIGSGNFSGTGNALANIIDGGDGNDRLDGAAGADILRGGRGNDTYVVDSTGDKIIEAAGYGTDTVQTVLASFTLADNLENLTYIGSGTFTGIGNAAANVLTGGDRNDRLYGNAGADMLNGGAGNDLLDGGTDADIMSGGAGDDTYVVDNTGDRISEAAGQGTDLVQTTLTSFTLGSNLENLTFVGSGNFTGIGNGLANVMIGGVADDRLFGNAGDDTLNGGSGNDTLDGGAGADTLIGGFGNDVFIVDNAGDQVMEGQGRGTDTVRTSLNSYTLTDNVENLAFTGSGNFAGTGNALANSITGGVGNDILNGGAGADMLIGGYGNDTYVVDNAADQVAENRGRGTDTVQTTLASYTLGDNLENLIYIGSGVFNGTGNALANTLVGGIGNDILNGGAGNDILEGGARADQLTGGDGADTFRYRALSDAASNRPDTITDFSVAEHDRIDLSAIDANSVGGGANDAFVFIAGNAFSGTAGELRFANGVLQADADGDRVADLTIRLTNVNALTASSIVL